MSTSPSPEQDAINPENLGTFDLMMMALVEAAMSSHHEELEAARVSGDPDRIKAAMDSTTRDTESALKSLLAAAGGDPESVTVDLRQTEDDLNGELTAQVSDEVNPSFRGAFETLRERGFFDNLVLDESGEPAFEASDEGEDENHE